MTQEKVVGAISEFNMFSKGDSVVIGLSGGKDSVALASILFGMRQELGITLSAVHVNHNLRGAEALRDENFVRKFCADTGIPLTVCSYDVRSIAAERGIGLEECGRLLRYEAFAAAKTDKIATAHTLSDSVETMLFNLSRGSGIKGLCGIPPKRGNIVRPLIRCTSGDILEYLAQNKIEYVNDSTNESLEYSRNVIRHKIIPELQLLNPSFWSSAEKTVSVMQNCEEYISQTAAELLSSAQHGEKYDAAMIFSAPEAIRSEAVKEAVESRTGAVPEYRHIKEICALCGAKGMVQINGGRYVRVRKGMLDFPEFAFQQPYKVPLKTGKIEITGGEIEIRLKNCEQIENSGDKMFSFMLDYDKINGEIFCRNRMAGDAFYDSKRKCTKTLKDFLNEKGVPPEFRNSYPVFVCGEKVIGTVGACVCSEYAADENTKRVLCVNYRRKDINGK